MILLAALNQVFFFFFFTNPGSTYTFLLAPCDSNYGGRGREAHPSHLLLGLKKKKHFKLSPWIQIASRSNWNDFHGCNNNVYRSLRAARARSSRKSMTEINTDKRHCCWGSSLNHIWIYNTMPIHFRSAPPWSPGWYGASRTKTFKCIPAVRIYRDNKHRIRDPVGAAP